MKTLVRGLGAVVVLLVLVLVGVFTWGGRALVDFPSMPSAYEAKEYCSCRWTSGRDAAFCDAFVHQTVVPTQGREVDEAAKSVTARALYVSHTARFVDERRGCELSP